MERRDYFTCVGGLINQLVWSMSRKEESFTNEWPNAFSNNLNPKNLKIVLNYHHGVTYSIKMVIKPWSFFRIMEGFMSLIKVDVMFSFPNVDPLSWGIALLLEKSAPEIRALNFKGTLSHSIPLLSKEISCKGCLLF